MDYSKSGPGKCLYPPECRWNYITHQPLAQPGDVKIRRSKQRWKIDEKDRVNLGSPFPDFTGGVNINMSWKGIDFSMFWYASVEIKFGCTDVMILSIQTTIGCN